MDPATLSALLLADGLNRSRGSGYGGQEEAGHAVLWWRMRQSVSFFNRSPIPRHQTAIDIDEACL